MTFILIYGLLSTAGLILWTFAEDLFGIHSTYVGVAPFMDILSAIIPVIVIYFGITRWRDHKNNGYLTFAQGFKTGMGIGVVSAILGAIFLSIYVHKINPGYVHALVTRFDDHSETSITAAQVDLARSRLVAGKLAFWMVTSFIISMYLAVWVDRRDGEPPAPEEPKSS